MITQLRLRVNRTKIPAFNLAWSDKMVALRDKVLRALVKKSPVSQNLRALSSAYQQPHSRGWHAEALMYHPALNNYHAGDTASYRTYHAYQLWYVLFSGLTIFNSLPGQLRLAVQALAQRLHEAEVVEVLIQL